MKELIRDWSDENKCKTENKQVYFTDFKRAT